MSPTAQAITASGPCHTGSSTTTSADPQPLRGSAAVRPFSRVHDLCGQVIQPHAAPRSVSRLLARLGTFRCAIARGSSRRGHRAGRCGRPLRRCQRVPMPPQAGEILKARTSDDGVKVLARFGAAAVSPVSETRTTERHPKNTQGPGGRPRSRRPRRPSAGMPLRPPRRGLSPAGRRLVGSHKFAPRRVVAGPPGRTCTPRCPLTACSKHRLAGSAP